MNKKMRERLDRLRFVGWFSFEMAVERNMRLVVGREKNVALYWLVDESDGVVSDAKFQAFGPPGLILAAEVASELALRKNHMQILRISAELIDQHMRDRKDLPSFPKEWHCYLNQVLAALDHAVEQCSDIPCKDNYEMTPIMNDFPEVPGGIPGWEGLALEQKRRLIEEVIDKEIRPYVELDAGGVSLVRFAEGGEVTISYTGSCTTCHASTGSTLGAIQQILRSRLHPSLSVTPEL